MLDTFTELTCCKVRILDDIQTPARALLERLPVCNLDRTARFPDDSFALELRQRFSNTCPPDPERDRKITMRQRNNLALRCATSKRNPASHPLFERMPGAAECNLGGVNRQRVRMPYQMLANDWMILRSATQIVSLDPKCRTWHDDGCLGRGLVPSQDERNVNRTSKADHCCFQNGVCRERARRHEAGFQKVKVLNSPLRLLNDIARLQTSRVKMRPERCKRLRRQGRQDAVSQT